MRSLTVALLLMPWLHGAKADVLVIDPDPAAYPVGTPQLLEYLNEPLRVSIQGASTFIFNPAGTSPTWRLFIAPPTGTAMQAGCYERGARFATVTRPGIDFAFESAGCNNTTGRYRVLDIQRVGDTVTSLAIDFVQQCPPLGKAVRGKLRFNSNVPVDGPGLRPVFDVTGVMSFTSQPGAIGGNVPGGSITFPLNRQSFTSGVSGDSSVSPTYSGPVPGSASTVSWRLDFAGPSGAPLQQQSYPNATKYPFQAAGVPGFAFSYGGSACDTLVASFNVSSIAFDGFDGAPLRFAATFNQRCPNSSGPLSSGSIAYDLNPIGPTSLPDPGIVFASGMESGEGGTYTQSCAQ